MHVKIKARDLLLIPPEQLEASLPDYRHVLVFDNGEELETNRDRTAYSRFFWRFHEEFPKIPLLPNHHLASLLKKSPYGLRTHEELCEIIIAPIIDAYSDVKDILGKVSMIAYQQSVAVVNFNTNRYAAHANSIDLLDAIQVVRHPQILEARDKVRADWTKIDEAYKTSEDVLLKDKSLDNNGLARACRAKTIKMQQVRQSVMMRGRPSETRDKLFDIPVFGCYIEGMNDPYEFASDSRSAPKAIQSTEEPLRNSSYMARRFQLASSPIEKIQGDDCGNTEYEKWHVLPKETAPNGIVTYPGGVAFLRGKFYFNEELGREVEIQGNEEELNGTFIQLRSLITCKNADPHTVCRKCFGGLWRNYYEHQNLGHLCDTEVTEKIIQNTMGQKHLVGSAHGEEIRLNELSAQYFTVGKKPTNYHLSPLLKKIDPSITVLRNESLRLLDVIRMQSSKDLRVNKITNLTEIRIDYTRKGDPMFDLVAINQGNKTAFATVELIDHILAHGMETTPQGDFKIDLKDWNYDNPIFAIPEMERSFAEHGAEFGKVIEANKTKMESRLNPDSVVKTMQWLFELATEKIDVQLSVLEIMVYTMMIPSRNNFALARGWKNPVLAVAQTLLTGRSLSQALAFQGHTTFMLDPKAFFPHFRPSSKMDVYFAPEETIRWYEDKEMHGFKPYL